MSATDRFDVFLSHNSTDKPGVEHLAQKLRQAGIAPFLDKWHLIPGEPWQEAMEEALDQSRTCAVFLGPGGLGFWENEEMRISLDERTRTPGFRVIPVLLPDAHMPERGRLPRFLSRLTWVDFRQGLDDADAFHRLLCGIQGIAPGAPSETRLPSLHICPYRGLEAFHEDNAEFFFGRDSLTQWLVEGLRNSRFLAVIGSSGCGKSSAVRAGLVPALRQGALPGSDTWKVVTINPGLRPLEELAAHLAPLLNGSGDRVADVLRLQNDLADDSRALHTAVRMVVPEAEPGSRVLFVVDQFEELFTLCEVETERRRFLGNLLYASAVAQGHTVVVLTMRADFYARAATYPELADRMADHQVLVTPMVEDELRQAIELPAQRVGMTFDPGLTESMMADVTRGPGALPLLEHALLELWQRRAGEKMTLEAYRAIGGVTGALARRAEEEYGALTSEQQVVARRILLRLVQPGEGTEDTCRRASLSELEPDTKHARIVEAIVERLADARLLTTGRGAIGSEEMVDVAHEALIRGWPRLRGWIDENREAMRVQRRLTEAAKEWDANRRDTAYVLRGVRLAEAREWVRAHDADLSELERQFLVASSRAVWRGRAITYGSIASVVFAVVAVASVLNLAISGQIYQWIYRPLPMQWRTIPPGSFVMGTTPQEIADANQIKPKDGGIISYILDNEIPAHDVYLDEYDINRFEVTNREYRQCVLARRCNPPANEVYDEADSDPYPVTGVTWEEARQFCSWIGGALPTEAQWEKAARANPDGLRRYPWGNQPDPLKANVKTAGLEPVGSRSPAGDSHFGVADMAGNVWEWVF